jgi:hypothetical protein
MAHEPRATVGGQLVGMGAEQGCNLGLDGRVSSVRAPWRKISVSGSASRCTMGRRYAMKSRRN